MSLLRSFGLKRYLASALTALAGILAADPSTAFLLPIISHLAALLGLSGLVHAGKDGALLEGKGHLSLGALFSLLIIASQHIPQLQKYHALLLALGSLLGLANVSLSSLPSAELKAVTKRKK